VNRLWQKARKPDGVVATAVETKEEARILASKKTLKVLVQDATSNSNCG
jgi:hypothetical protein